MDALKETELNKAFLESIYNMYERNIKVFVFDAPCWIDGFPYSKSALRRKKMGVEASFPKMVKDIIKWESDLKEIFQEKYSVEYVKKIRNSVKTIKVSGKYVREDYISELINYIGGKRVTCYQPQEYSKTLHIYGRCIVTGTFVADADTFPSRFQKLLTDHGHSDIRVVNHGIPGDPERVMMKHNIIMDSPDYKDDDIVMIMNDWHKVKKTLESINVQVTDLSAHWPVNDITVSQFFHNPVHMGYKGYDLLAGIVYKIFIDNFGKKGEGIYKIKKPTDYPFSMKKYIAAEETEKDIEKGVSEYTGKILRDHPLTESIKKIGAVVMNCNPFTFGHRHLIEYASKNVDRLYVFCVEEDRSFFRFEDRIDMIRKGTSDLKNVIVIPSGRFIISTTTFPEYFEKENIEDEKVDVTEDLTIFCKKIAPKLGITKRFAGEEPFDPVTGQYNEKMREMLPENGLEFEAIPRKRSEGSDVISATTVRQLMAQKEYEKLLSLVPETTYDIIMEKYVYQKKTKITEKEMIIRDRSELPPEISVVIPMYNCEQFVPKLLKMFSEQSFTDFEVICVIDGATDGTEEAVKEYCKIDDRFRYIVRENGGAGAARNTGIKEAKGKYIVFSDADDEYYADYLKVLYETAEKNNAQIVISRFEENESTKSSIRGFNTDHFREDKIYSHNKIKKLFSSFNPRVPNKLFDINFIRDKGLLFLETRIGEDNYFSCTCLSVADRIVVSHAILSKYRIRFGEDSLTGNRRVYLEDSVTVLRQLYQWLKNHSLLDIHMQDYLEKVNRTIIYNGSFGSTSGYISEMAHLLNAEEPWKDFSTEYAVSFLESSLFPYDDIRKWNEVQARIEDNKTVSERELFFQKRRKNRINTADLLRQTSKELYDRDFESALNKHRIPLNANEKTGHSQIKTVQNNKPEVSVVIPMYNCEEFVPELLKMFSAQSFADFEVICVIDGATDGTEEVVKKYCKIDDRFRCVVRENGGAGAARNTGIDEAKGKYILFSDADDLYSNEYLLKLYEAAEAQNADIAVCEFTVFDYIANEKRPIGSFNKKIFIEGGIYSAKKEKRIIRRISIQIAANMFRLAFIKKHKLKFSETPVSNDLFFSKAALVRAERIVFTHNNLITIRRHINSKSISSNRGKNSHIALGELRKFYNWLDEHDLLSTFISDYLWLFDVTVNYEIKNGVNTIFAKEMAHILNNDAPWNNLSNTQIKNILTRSMGDERNEQFITFNGCVNDEEIERIQFHNEIATQRNNNKKSMQRMIKEYSIKNFSRDLDEHDSVAPCDNQEEPLQDNNDILQKKGDGNVLVNNTPEITVIIPMYNCAGFVNDVLTMFSKQSFFDFEAICVIDGATDNTEELVKEYCEKDNRFSYIYKKNGGPGSARNAGMDIARGRYIIFSDADDEYSIDYLKKLYEAAVKNDAQITNCLFSQKGVFFTQNMKEQGFDKKVFFENIVYSHRGIDDLFMMFQSRVTNKLYSSRFLRTYGLRFPEKRIAEDACFSYAGLSVADRIAVVHDTLFSYKVNNNPESLMDNSKKYLCDVADVYRFLYHWLKEHSLLEIHGSDYMRRMDRALQFYGGKGTTPKFISEIAHMFNEEEPWNLMTSGEILEYFKESLFAEIAIKKESEINTIIKSEVSYKKREDYKYKLFKYRNMIHTSELLRRVSLERYGRDLSKTDSLPDNVNGSSSRSLPVDDKKDSKQLIVSFTSYPARIRFVHQVLESLYAQSLQADKIILWLAEEQFPNKEEDLPEELLKDATTGKFELRWCDDLGSHKKYFYTMQECPHDIVVTVDDDIIYDSKMLETLYESYLRFPTAVSANQVSCMLFSSEGELLPCSSWILPYKAIKNNASLQLMAIGSRGILYPPGLFDKSVFDVKVIKELCGFRGTCFLNDSWLKIHELLNGISVVFTGGTLNSSPLEAVQEIRIKSSPENDRLLQEQESSMWKKMQNDHSQSDKFNKSIAMIKNSATFVSDEESGIFDNVACIFEDLVTEQNNTTECVFTQIVNTSIRELNRLKTLGVSEEKWNKYLEKYQSILLKITGRVLSMDTLSFYALRDYGYILSKGLYGARYRDSSQYNQMLASWKSFFLKYPECNDIYKNGYNTFTKNMKKAKSEGLVI